MRRPLPLCSGESRFRQVTGLCPLYVVALLATLLLMLFGGCDPDVIDDSDPTPESLEYLPSNALLVGSIEDGRIWAIDLTSSDETPLVSGSDPTVTPEETLICVHSAGLVEYVPGGVGYRVIVSQHLGQPFDEVYNDAFHLPRVSPDGSMVCYGGDFHNVFVVDRESGELLHSWVTGDNFTGFDRPVWTPDNRLVMAGTEENPGIFVTDSSLERMEVLDPWLPEGSTDPDVSPDGEQVLFTLGEDIYRAPTDRSGWFEEVISTGHYLDMPTWSDDGTLIAWVEMTYDYYGQPYYHSDRRGYRVTLYDQVTNEIREYQLSRDAEYLHPYGFTPQIVVR